MATCFDIILFWFVRYLNDLLWTTRWCIVCTLNVLEILLQMVMSQSFPAWAEEGMISRATGVVWLILILV